MLLDIDIKHTQYIVAVLKRPIQFKMKHSNQEAVLVKKSKYAHNDVERKCMKL